MQSARAVSFGQNCVTLGCLEVAGRVFAVDVGQLREVVRWQATTPLPNAPRLIDGVVDLRGQVIPVVDLARALGLGNVQPGSRSRIAVADIDGLVVGFAVESAFEVLSVEVSQLEDPPALATHTGYDAVRAIVRRPGGEPVLVLSLEHLLERVYRSALPASEASP